MPIQTKVVDLKSGQADHSLYHQCLRLRRDLFISQMGWNLYECMGCEFDEYDTPASVHIVAVDDGDILGCLRLLRTDNLQGQTTYMILDADLGRIPNLPKNIMSDRIQSPLAWEASRLAISSDVEAKDRNSVILSLIKAAERFVAAKGGQTILGLMNPAFERIFRRNGISAYRFGPVLAQRDGRICVLRLDFSQDALPASAEHAC